MPQEYRANRNTDCIVKSNHRSIVSCLRSHKAAFCSILSIFSPPLAAFATEGGGSTYPIGVATIVPGFVVGEPGLNLLNYNTYYSADRLNNATGGKALPIFHADVAATIVRLDYAPGWKLFGGNFGVQVIMPFADVSVDRQIGTRRQKDSKTGIGDTFFVPFALSWTGQSEWGRWATGVKLHVVAPTGAYRATDLANIGRNYTSEIATYAVSLLTPDGWHAGFQANYIINQTNAATSYRSGDEFEVDYAVGHKLNKNITLELNGYFYQQLQKDRRFGTVVGTGNEGRAIGIGPQVRVALPEDIALVAKWQHEVSVRNRAEGDRFWLQLFVPFGNGKPTAPADNAKAVARPVEVAGR